LLAVIVYGAVAPLASADVLLSAPPTRMTNSGCLTLGVWYQQYSGGPRTIRVSVFRPSGRRVVRKTIVATTHWRDHLLKCGMWPFAGRWRTHITGAGLNVTYITRVRLDQD
jgi:hypothetical protein